MRKVKKDITIPDLFNKAKKPVGIIINGIHYKSLNKAMAKTNINEVAMRVAIKTLNKSSMSEIEKNIKITTRFSFKYPDSV